MTTPTRLFAALFAALLLWQLAPAADAGKQRSRKLALLVKGWDCDH